MKKWSFLVIVMMITLSVSATFESKPAPWNVFSSKRTVTSSVYFCNTCGTPYGRIDIHLNRGFAYNTCEYTTVYVLVYTKFGVGKYAFWAWTYRSSSLTFESGSADAYFSFELKNGEQVHTDANGEVISSDVIVDNLSYCY